MQLVLDPLKQNLISLLIIELQVLHLLFRLWFGVCWLLDLGLLGGLEVDQDDIIEVLFCFLSCCFL